MNIKYIFMTIVVMTKIVIKIKKEDENVGSDILNMSWVNSKALLAGGEVDFLSEDILTRNLCFSDTKSILRRRIYQ